MTDIYLNMPESTGSPRGSSTIEAEFTCGRKAHYAELAKLADQDQASSLPSGDDSLNALLVGTCFHWLARTRPAVADCKPKPHWNNEQVEAARVYRAAVELDYFGGLRIIDAEWPFDNGLDPSDPAYFSGQADAIAETTDDRFGYPPGTIVGVDWKTTSRKRPADYYLCSSQAHLYYSLLKELRGIEAHIFLEIAKVKTITAANITRHVFTGPAWPLSAVTEWAAAAHQLKTNKVRNLAACKGGEYGPPCPFFIQCYGEFHDSNSST